MNDFEILGRLEAGHSVKDVIDVSNKPRTKILTIRDKYKKTKMSKEVDDLLFIDKVEIEKSKHTTLDDIKSLAKYDGGKIVPIDDMSALKTKTEVAALRILDCVNNYVLLGTVELVPSDLVKLAEVVVKINESFFREAKADQTNIYNMNGDLKAFQQTLKD